MEGQLRGSALAAPVLHHRTSRRLGKSKSDNFSPPIKQYPVFFFASLTHFILCLNCCSPDCGILSTPSLVLKTHLLPSKAFARPHRQDGAQILRWRQLQNVSLHSLKGSTVSGICPRPLPSWRASAVSSHIEVSDAPAFILLYTLFLWTLVVLSA